MLSIARAIVEPRKLLLIDEPTKGLAPAIVVALIDAFRRNQAPGATILLVEQNFHVARATRRHRRGDGQRQDRASRRRWRSSAQTWRCRQRLLGLSLEAHQ